MKYEANIYQMTVEGHTFWVAESAELKGCAGQGETMAEAVKELEENEIECVKAAREEGIPVPAPRTKEDLKNKALIRKAKDESRFKLIGLKGGEEVLIGKEETDCPVCGKTHEVLKYKHNVLHTYDIGWFENEEIFYRCQNADAGEGDYLTGGMMNKNAEGRRAKLAALIKENI